MKKLTFFKYILSDIKNYGALSFILFLMLWHSISTSIDSNPYEGWSNLWNIGALVFIIIIFLIVLRENYGSYKVYLTK
jgi:hypothetical protein